MDVLLKPSDPQLHKKAAPAVVGKSSDIVKRLRRICRSVSWGNCVGMAAPQIGVRQRVFIADSKAYINPKIIWYSDDKDIEREGCYSVEARTYHAIKRSKIIVVEWWGARGVHHIARLTGRAARIVQHEYDHLDGIVITDKAEY